MVANNTSARLQPTARSLVQGSLVWNHHYAIKQKAMMSSLRYSIEAIYKSTNYNLWIWNLPHTNELYDF